MERSDDAEPVNVIPVADKWRPRERLFPLQWWDDLRIPSDCWIALVGGKMTRQRRGKVILKLMTVLCLVALFIQPGMGMITRFFMRRAMEQRRQYLVSLAEPTLHAHGWSGRILESHYGKDNSTLRISLSKAECSRLQEALSLHPVSAAEAADDRAQEMALWPPGPLSPNNLEPFPCQNSGQDAIFFPAYHSFSREPVYLGGVFLLDRLYWNPQRQEACIDVKELRGG